ncbi:Epsin-3 [Chytriomyces hyalinus]|nr:Epsin-3 [Chytriomyces hyalinus]
MLSIRRSVKNFTQGYSDTELRVRSATANNADFPSDSELSTLAARTHELNDFREIMRIVEKRLNDIPKNWRHVEKALALLDHLLLAGSKMVFIVAKHNIVDIEQLQQKEFRDASGDHSRLIHQLSANIVAFLNDEERLNEIRLMRESNLPKDRFNVPSNDTQSQLAQSIRTTNQNEPNDSALFASAFEGLPPSQNPDKDAANPFSDFAAAHYTNSVIPLNRLPLYSPSPLVSKQQQQQQQNQQQIRKPDAMVVPSVNPLIVASLDSQSRQLPQPPPEAFYTAIYEYKGKGASDLALRTGDRVQVLVRGADGWWRGRCSDGREGVFPSNYVISEIKSA